MDREVERINRAGRNGDAGVSLGARLPVIGVARFMLRTIC